MSVVFVLHVKAAHRRAALQTPLQHADNGNLIMESRAGGKGVCVWGGTFCEELFKALALAFVHRSSL